MFSCSVRPFPTNATPPRSHVMSVGWVPRYKGDPHSSTSCCNIMSSAFLEESVISEGRIHRDDAIGKLHLLYLRDVTPEDLIDLPFDEFDAAANQVVGLLSSAFARVRVTHHKWLMYGFNCGSTSAFGDHRNANPNAQIKRDAGWHFGVSGLSCDAGDIAAEHARAFAEGEKKRRYQADFSEAMETADASFRDLRRKVREVKSKWDSEHAEKVDDFDEFDDIDDDDDDFNQHQIRQQNDGHHGPQVPAEPRDFNKLEKLDELLADARNLHENLVDMVLRFLPGRTFLKS